MDQKDGLAIQTKPARRGSSAMEHYNNDNWHTRPAICGRLQSQHRVSYNLGVNNRLSSKLCRMDIAPRSVKGFL